MSVAATLAMWHPAHSDTGFSAAAFSYGIGWCPKVKKPQPFVFAKRLLSFTVKSIPLYAPLKVAPAGWLLYVSRLGKTD